MRLLILRLEAPLQSWGERSKWDNRDSGLMPTKSGIIGIIACCMGLPRDDGFIAELHQKLSVAVRADMPGRLGTDYHTVTSESMMNAEGKPQERTIVSFRQYLQDASFLAVLASEEPGLLDEIANAMKHPKWPAYLGRKCCVPTYPLLPVVTDEYSSMTEAIENWPLAERADPDMDSFRAEIDDPHGKYGRNDNLCSRGRHFSVRRVEYHIVRRKAENVSFKTEA